MNAMGFGGVVSSRSLAVLPLHESPAIGEAASSANDAATTKGRACAESELRIERIERIERIDELIA
jgi:hypothetical protein